MAVFRRKPAPVELVAEPPAPEPVAELPREPHLRRFAGDPAKVIFASDGVHYPLLFDENGEEQGPDRSQPLRFNADGNGWFYYHAREDDPTHFHTYHVGHVDVVPE